MEQFVLGIFQEHLGKFIVGFRKEMVNANLLNGKGEIRDISINCSAINEQISNITPFIELESIHISKLGFQVTSWTNLRKAPIVVDIEHITVHISEPLHYLTPRKRKRIRQMTVAEMEQHFRQLEVQAKKNKTNFSNPNKRGAYSLLDRIVDNLQIEIKSVYVQFQTFGKFKTRRPGPWTPPTIQFILRNLRFVSVDEYGQEGTPEEVWNHNHQAIPRGQERTLLIFKKVSMDYDFGVRTSDGQQFSLLKGGGGVPPRPPGTTAAAKDSAAATPPKPVSPTAAETVAALAATTGPIEVPVSAPTAAETVAALAATTGSTTGMPPPPNKDSLHSSNGSFTGSQATGDSKAGVQPTNDNKGARGEEKQQTKTSSSNKEPSDGHNNTVVVHMAMKRRVRDGALLALQVDTTLSKVEVLIPSEVVPCLVHAASGLEYCFCKDRGYEDPLRHPDDRTDHNDSNREFGTTMEKENQAQTATKDQNGGDEDTAGTSTAPVPKEVTDVSATKSDQAPLTVDNGDVNLIKNDTVAGSSLPELGPSGVGQEGEVSAETETGPDEKPDDPEKLGDSADSGAILEDGIEGIEVIEDNSLAADILSVIDETTADDNTDIDTLDGRSTASQLHQTAAGLTNKFTNLFKKQSVASSGTETANLSEETTKNSSVNKNRAIVMLPNGLIIHEKVSMSVSVDRAIVRGVYSSSKKPSGETSLETTEYSNGEEKQNEQRQEQTDERNGFIQLDSKGAVLELIWPKANQEKGGYVQASVSNVSIQERFGQRVRTIVAGGIQHESSSDRPIETPMQITSEIDQNDTFPLYQDRAIRDDPLGTRETFPAQAIGLLAAIDYQSRERRPQKSLDALSLPSTITTTDTPPTYLSPKMTSASERTSVSFDGSHQPQEVELVNVIKVTNDCVVDRFNVVLDCDSWCRVMRFALNEEGDGFDPRWYSGDWTDCLSTEMLVHPNTPLELENHLQPRKQIFLDENDFISSDLFNMNANVSNCELRVPAAIQQNVRSCDIVINIEEVLLTVCSELPRTLSSRKEGKVHVIPDNTKNERVERINFPNDPSDIAYQELGNSEENDEVKRYSNKTKSTFRLKMDIGNLSTRIVPVIPFYIAAEPQLLCAPTNMKLLLCFEGEPPETDDSNLIKMSLFASMAIHQIHMNCDLDLVAGAISTCLHHFQVVKETIECAKQLVPVFEAPPDPKLEEMSFSNSEGVDDMSSAKSGDESSRIKKTLRGHHILVHRQFHRSRETGGLKIAVDLKVSDYSFTLWRQNVSTYSPLRPSDRVADAVDRQKLYFPLVRLLYLTAADVDLGVEVLFREDDRRTVIKCSLCETQMKVCDLSEEASVSGRKSRDAEYSSPTPGDASAPEDKASGNGEGVENTADAAENATEEDKGVGVANAPKPLSHMVEIFSIGRDVSVGVPATLEHEPEEAYSREECILIRCEEHFGPLRSRSIAGDIATGGTVNIHIDELETLFLLILEALMMPTWSRAKLLPRPGGRAFPESSIGALLLSLIPGSGGPFPGFLWLFRAALSAALTAAFPTDLRLFLMRLRLGTLLVSIPEPKQLPKGPISQTFAVLLRRCDLLSWYFSPEGGHHSDLLSVLANNSESWSSLVADQTAGWGHRIVSRQGFNMAEVLADSALPSLTELVPEFEVCLEYIASKVVTSVENTLSTDDLERLSECFRFLRRFSVRGVAIYNHLKARLTTLCGKKLKHGATETASTTVSPVGSACWDVQQSISSVRDGLGRICRSLEDLERDNLALLKEKDADLQQLRRLVFSKEKEKVSAVTIASSHVAGWLRMGGTHQSGQRVATTSTLWVYWAVLRKEMIVLYKGPGKWHPIDFVFLRGARLRLLEGGKNKRDLKRAFGIVENGGKTRFFIVETDHEYIAWTREIQTVTGYSQAPDVLKVEAEADNASHGKATSDRDDESLGFDSTGPVNDTLNSSHHGSVGTPSARGSQLRGKLAGIGTALRISKQNSSPGEMEAGTTQEQGIEGNSVTIDSLESRGTVSSVNADTAVTEQRWPVEVTNQDVALDSPQAPPRDAGGSERPTGSNNRRLQIKGKLSGAGQATTNRLGSAFMAARQKGREVAERRRSSNASPAKLDHANASSDTALHVISEKEDDNMLADEKLPDFAASTWTCPKCTFVNTLKGGETDIVVCEMCECPSELFDVEVCQPDEKADQKEQEANASDLGRIKRSESCNSIAGRDRFSSTDSDKGLYRRSQSDTGSVEEDEISILSDFAADETEAARVGGRRSMRNRFGTALGGIRRPNQNKQPGEADNKGWLGRLGGSNVSSQESSDGFRKPQAPLKLKNVRVDQTSDFPSIAGPTVSDLPLSKLEGHWCALVRPVSTSGPTPPKGNPPASEMFLTEDARKDDVQTSTEEANKSDRTTDELPLDRNDAENPTGQLLAVSVSGDSAGTRSTKEPRNNSFENFPADSYYRIQIFHQGPGVDTKQPMAEVTKGLSEIASFHAILSEFITEAMLHPVFQETSLHRMPSGEMSDGLRNALGISPMDSIRISGDLLAGVLDANTKEFATALPPSYNAEAIMEFLNASLECPLPSDAIFAVTDFFGIHDAPTEEVSSPGNDDSKEGAKEVAFLQSGHDNDSSPVQLTEDKGESLSARILALSSTCTSELLHAEQSGMLASKLAEAMSPTETDPDISPSSFFEPLLPTHITEHLQEAMHSALMKVMAERDEAHAQLVSASVLHAHTLEQEKKKVERLEAQLEIAHNKAARPPMAASVSSVFANIDKKKHEQEKAAEDKIRHREFERMQQNSDAELIALCQQLSGEISSRTKAALEVIRLKESRAIERRHEADEKEALKNELIRVRELLAKEQSKAEESRREAEKWRDSYEKVAENQKRERET